jgi:hypothetical protein
VADSFRIIIENEQAVKYLTGKEEGTRRRVTQIMNLVTRDIKEDAREIIRSTEHIWQGRLINSILNRVSTSGDHIVGEVFSGVDYAIYVHEGTRRHYVPFVDRNGMDRLDLIWWARSHGLITMKGKQFISTITGQPIRGITVGIEATKFLEQPYQKHLNNFVTQIQRAGAE